MRLTPVDSLLIEVTQYIQSGPVSRSRNCAYEWPRTADPTGGG